MELEQEGKEATKLLKGKTVSKIYRHRIGELVIVFTDDTTLYVDKTSEGLELSITGGKQE